MTSILQPTDRELAAVIPRPTSDSHKYTRGVLGLLTGSDTYPGAALMSIRAAVNTGLGLAKFYGTPSLNTLVHLSTPEAVTSTGDPFPEHVDAWALGSGVTGDDRLQQVGNLLTHPAPAVIDAGAISPAAQLIADGYRFTPAHILTPHAGELETFLTWLEALAPNLLSQPAPNRQTIEAEPASWAREAARVSGASVLLKGGTSYLASPTGTILSLGKNTPWLATAGSGDTLTGILGALLAQYRASKSQETEIDTREEDYLLLACAALRIHGLAAAFVHPGGFLGPVPPSILAPQIPQALAQLIGQQA